MSEMVLEQFTKVTEKTIAIKIMYGAMALGADSKKLKQYFKKRSSERRNFAKQLALAIMELGGKFKGSEARIKDYLQAEPKLKKLGELSDQELLDCTLSANKDILDDYGELLSQETVSGFAEQTLKGQQALIKDLVTDPKVE